MFLLGGVTHSRRQMQKKSPEHMSCWRKNSRKRFTFVLGPINHVPSDAVYAGIDKEGGLLYAGRAYHECELLPGYISPKHGGAFVSCKGQEYSKMEFELLQTTHSAWKYARNGQIPPGALVFGASSEGEKLYLGRVMHNGCLTPGCVYPSRGSVFIHFEGKELRFKDYEVLIML